MNPRSGLAKPKRRRPRRINPLLQDVASWANRLPEVSFRPGVRPHDRYRLRHPDAQVAANQIPIAVTALDNALGLGGLFLVVVAAIALDEKALGVVEA